MKQMNLIITLFIGIIILPNCQKDNELVKDDNISDSTSITEWVLISKDKLNTSRVLRNYPTESDSLLPITLTFANDNQVCGFHDANEYEGEYTISNKNLSFNNVITTEVGDTEWYWTFLRLLEKVEKYTMIEDDTLKLYGETDNLAIVLLKKHSFNSSVFNVDSLYSYFSSDCAIDTQNLKNELQGTSWVVLFTEKAEQNKMERIFSPDDDNYPITFCIHNQDSISGKHDANAYQGNCTIIKTDIKISNLNITDVGDNDWYWDYIAGLSKISKIEFFTTDSLKLYNNDSTLLYNYLGKELFNQNHFNVDSIYRNN